MKFASDFQSAALTSGIQDRAFAYDHAGRIAKAVSGSEARDLRDDTNSNLSDGPFKQIYTHNAWDNLVGRNGRYWTQDDNVTASYDSHLRNTAWSYDPDGRLLSMNEASPNGFPFQSPRHEYDAVGDHVGVTQAFSQVLIGQGLFTTSTTRSQKYDGDGQEVKRVETTQTNNLQPFTKTTHYLRSAALGGEVIGQVDGQGVLKGSYVLARGAVLAQFGHNADGSAAGVLWEHPNPITGDVIISGVTGGFARATHLDPQGIDVGDEDPFPSGDSELFSPPGDGGGKLAPFGNIGGHSRCVLDGMETLCAFVSNAAAAQCEDNNCGARWNPNINNGRGSYGAFEFFHSFANGYGGWMTAYGLSHYEGGRDFYNSPYNDDQEIKSRLNRTPDTLFSHSPQNPAQQPQDTRSPNQKACDDKIAGIFGGPRAVAATVAEPTTLLSSNRNRNPAAAYAHMAGNGVFHLYTNAQGTESTVGLYKPPGGRLVSGGQYDNGGQTENYFRFSYTRGPLAGVTISFVHVGGTHGGDAGGQYLGLFPGEPNRIGNIGGLGGGGFGYNHSHVKVYNKGKLTDPRKIFCKEFGF